MDPLCAVLKGSIQVHVVFGGFLVPLAIIHAIESLEHESCETMYMDCFVLRPGKCT